MFGISFVNNKRIFLDFLILNNNSNNKKRKIGLRICCKLDGFNDIDLFSNTY